MNTWLFFYEEFRITIYVCMSIAMLLLIYFLKKKSDSHYAYLRSQQYIMKEQSFGNEAGTLTSIQESSFSKMSCPKARSYVKLIFTWIAYKEIDGPKELEQFDLPVSHSFWDSLVEGMVQLEEMLHRGVTDLNIDSVTLFLQDYARKGVEMNTAFDLYYEFGLPNGFNTNEKIFAITFTNGYCHFISFDGNEYKVKAKDILSTSLLPSRDRIKLRLKVKVEFGYNEIVIFLFNSGEKDIDFMDWINKRVQEQQKVCHINEPKKTINKKELKKYFLEVLNKSSIAEQIICLHALLEKNLRETLGIQNNDFLSLINEGSSRGIIFDVEGLHKARKLRNRLAHEGNLTPKELEQAKSYYEAVIRTLC